ncbi:potassium channel family protein [Chroococcus sp. FPU101]|uniref:potassium channel family protein n=1 Tax=Chroococcus sp. FPU101 TaxID=1974212 RepID=UPI001A903A70|nr:potassium channel family protein [Chroococcus sp. FPU101]GFE67802.1 hypothetical protein CFPU101_04120 [Chroococcus sp. FPU101]
MTQEKFLNNLYNRLLFVLVFLALASSFWFYSSLVRIILSLILVIFIYSVIHTFYPHKKFHRNAYLSFAVITLCSQILIETKPSFLGRPFLVFLIGIINLSFLGLAIYLIAEKVAQADRVNDDILKGGICIYFLIGIWFGFLYEMIYFLDEKSFYISPLNHQNIPFEPIYYSFTTLTTLGFGDILPVARITKVLSVLEAMLGVFYVAISVSRLVSLFITEEMKKRD